MLPSHLLPDKDRNSRGSDADGNIQYMSGAWSNTRSHANQTRQRLGGEPLAPRGMSFPAASMPSLCVTGAMSQVGRYNVPSHYLNSKEGGKGPKTSPVTLYYIIFRPRQRLSETRPPLVVCHGGPSIPSNYLLPLLNGITDRTIIFYDQYGCGKSSRPSHASTLSTPFDISLMVTHLELLLNEWGLKQFHLLGHSFGGILAYEFLLKQQSSPSSSPRCRSLVLMGAPTDAQQILQETKRLFRKVNGWNTEEEGDDSEELMNHDNPAEKLACQERFRREHECRLDHVPLALMDALDQAGPTRWRGAPAIPNYTASSSLQPGFPSLVLRGEFDFCTESCIEGWQQLLSGGNEDLVEYQTLPACSHYAMLENEQLCGKVISEFLVRQDTLMASDNC
eukprot:Nitzschia sp. Nitz4//scaffold111_size72815//14805//15983//NITZ4_005781-RA/size72815-processed-gene-0.62-mRNA-1//-1//CDS//3329533153//7416//frame0